MRWLLRLLAGCLTAAAVPGPARAGDAFYLSIFTAETVPFRPTETHTFVVAVRVPCSGATPEMHHISWCPANLKQRGLTVLPERGVNLPLPDTFAMCRDRGMRVSLWGPYRVEPELFELLRGQVARLESGRVLYKPTDNLYHSDVAANCYHAIWRPVAPCRKYSGAFNCGDATGGMTVRLFRPWLVDPCQTHDWLLDLFVPPGEPILRRGYDDRPTRLDAIRSAVGR